MSDQLPTLDPPVHTDQRALLMRLITPKRLRENEEFMWRLADRQLDTFLGDGRCEFISQFAAPFAMLVIAICSVFPRRITQRFADALLHGQSGTGAVGGTGKAALWPTRHLSTSTSLHRICGGSSKGSSERCPHRPRHRHLPGRLDARRLGCRSHRLEPLRRRSGDHGPPVELRRQAHCRGSELQGQLRAHRELIPNFIEETLRMESPVKGDFRMSKVPTNVGGVDLAAGTTVMLVNAGSQP